ncbi:MAG TPA: hypothetical protein VHM16_05805, partial [Rubrobacteraceae bacterium]|nr:hypothetical protein [Rubrobacteraceae bacterium]
IVLVSAPHLGPVQYLFMFGSGVLHLGYFVLLQRGYAVGDLSLVYPLARGTGPLLATAAAIVLFGERPSLLVYIGIALITAGVFVLTSESGSLSTGLGTGVVFTPVSYVAPAREISILIGVLMGASLLAEGNVRQRLIAAGAMVLGIAALALG